MSGLKPALVALLFVAACDGNPFDPDAGNDTQSGGGGFNTDHILPPGTENPTPGASIFRSEPLSGETGNGYAEGISYDPATDTFMVDGLAFDGANVYKRDNQVATLGGYKVFEGNSTYADDVTGAPIAQFAHRALYGVSKTGKTEFAVVRTGGYIGYGFGGFIYQRNGKVTLPSSGQAHYQGDYAALRDFDGAGGIEYATGTMVIDIDFNDFNNGPAVRGAVYDRAIYDVNGNDITGSVVGALNEDNSTPISELPVLTFVINPNALDSNGEMTGEVQSNYQNSGTTEKYEEGVYYGIIAGEGSTEIVGIIVVEATDPRLEGVTVRETGGFILYRE